MSSPATSRRPSNDLGELREQLLRELQRLEDAGPAAEEPELFRSYLQHIQALAWERVARGELGAPREILDHLLEAQPFVDAHRPVLEPASRASIEIERVVRSFYLADRVLETVRVERRLSDRRSETEKEVLRVLLENREEYLCRGDVLERMAEDKRRTPGRIGQILVDLYHDGLLQRVHGSTQGSPNASFYAVSPRGLDVCQRIGIPVPKELPEEEEPAFVDEVVSPLEQVEDPAKLVTDDRSSAGVHWKRESFPAFELELGSKNSSGPEDQILYEAVAASIDPSREKIERELAAGLVANSLADHKKILDILRVMSVKKSPDVHYLIKELVRKLILTKGSGVAITPDPGAKFRIAGKSGENAAERQDTVSFDQQFLKEIETVAEWEGAPSPELRNAVVVEAIKSRKFQRVGGGALPPKR